MSDPPISVSYPAGEISNLRREQSSAALGVYGNWQTAFGYFGVGVIANPYDFTSMSTINPAIFLGVVQVAVTEYQRQWNLTILSLENNIRHLTKEMEALKEEVRQLCRTRTFVVPLTTLAPAPFRITRQIPVTIEGDGEEFTATFTEASLSASGDTEAEAIDNFKDALLSSYDIYESMPESKLGKSVVQQWNVIKSVVQRAE